MIGDDERFVSSIDLVVGEPTTASWLWEVVDRASGSSALPATLTLTADGSASGASPVKVKARAAVRRPSPAPSVGWNWTCTVQMPPPPGTTRVGQLSVPILKSAVSERRR